MATVSFTREIKLDKMAIDKLLEHKSDKTVLNATDVERKLKRNKELLMRGV